MKCKLNSSKRKNKQAILLEYLSNYKSYKDISKALNIGKSAISRAFKRYINKGWINQDRALTDDGLHLIKDTHSSIKYVNNIKPDEVRGHAFVFVLQKPSKIKKWNQFQTFLELKNIKFKKISPTIDGERIIINSKKIWRTRRGFVFYMGKNQSYRGSDAYESFNKVLLDVFDIIHQLEKIMGVSLRGTNGYQLRCSRSHFSLMKNALAMEYNKKKKKFYVYDTKGMWFVIDDSFHLGEAEFPRAETNQEETTIMQDHFNFLKANPDILEENYKRIIKISKNQTDLTLLMEQVSNNLVKIGRKLK